MAHGRRIAAGIWLELRVIPVLLWSFTAVTLGTALAWAEPEPRRVGGYLVAVAVGVLLQGLVAHCVNEIVDWRSGTDRHPAPRAISGGSKVIASGLLGVRALACLGVAAALAVVALGITAASVWGWGLLAYGVGGLVGAVFYTLPPVRAAYRPFLGEAVAFACVWACVTGAYLLQRGAISGAAALAGVTYGASCVAMLMMHHYLDRVPDLSARPPKRTSVVRLGAGARRYAVGWALVAAGGAVALTLVHDRRFAILALALTAAVVLHAIVVPDDPVRVTRCELGVIVLGMAGGLATAAALAPPLAWTLIAAAVLVPAEMLIARAVLGAPPEEPPSGPIRPESPLRATSPAPERGA